MPAIPDSFYIDLTTVKGVSRTTAEFQHLLNPPSVLTARGITITDEQRYQLLREVAKALAFLHRIGVCVGDISPKNLLFSLNPRPAVYFIDCDAMRVNGVSVLPQMETPDWEVPAGEELATIYSDTYKLGLLALRLLAGDQHTKDLQQLPPTTPKLLRQLIADTLTNEPRPATPPRSLDIPPRPCHRRDPRPRTRATNANRTKARADTHARAATSSTESAHGHPWPESRRRNSVDVANTRQHATGNISRIPRVAATSGLQEQP